MIIHGITSISVDSVAKSIGFGDEPCNEVSDLTAMSHKETAVKGLQGS